MTKDPLEARVNRVEGQISAIKRMYIEGSECLEIVQQIQAARAALGKLAGLLLTAEAKRCASEGNVSELKKVVEKTFKTV